MYSRSMRNNREKRVFNQNELRENVNEQRPDGVIIPEPPPNYRGMIYGDQNDGKIYAEGIDRLADNDQSYRDYEKTVRKREYRQIRDDTTPVNIQPDIPKSEKTGLHRLIDGLSEKSFGAEDILICAMIILMLNGSSEDDILMVLVLMMLL